MSYHSSFAGALRGQDCGTTSQVDGANLDYYRFSGDGRTIAAPMRNARAESSPSDCQIVDESSQHPYEYAEDDLRHAKSTAARLTALEKIASSGVERFKFKDKDGVEREFRVETQECGEKTLIHCYAKDSRGGEQIVMRAARNASGEIEQERNKDGKPVSYYGDNWSRTMQGKSFLVGDKQEGAAHEEKRSTGGRVREHESAGKERSRDSEHSHVKREKERDCDGERSKKQDTARSRRDAEDERDSGRRRGDSCEERGERRLPRIDVGRALADVASIAAPFLMAQLSNRNRCNDLYPYREYPQHLPERGCRNYYDNYRHNDFDGRGRYDFDGFKHHEYEGNHWGRPHHSNYRVPRQLRCR